MIIRFFRSSFLAQYVMIVLTALVLWLPAFVNPEPAASPDALSPVYHALFRLASLSPLASTLFAFALMVFMGVMLNTMLAKYQLIGRVSSMATFVWVLLMSLSPAQTKLYPMLAAMPLLLYAVGILFRMYDSSENELDIFNVAFLMSLASLIWFPALVLMVWIYLALFVLRITHFRAWIIPLVGMLTPYLFLATWYFMGNELLAQLKVYVTADQLIYMPNQLPSVTDLLVFGLLTLMVAKSISIAYTSVVDNNISIRKRKAIMNVLMFVSVLLLFFKAAHPAHQLLLLVPATVYLAFSYTFIKKYFRAQLFLLLLFVLALANNYLPLLR